jgi:hypothetical protein
MVRERRGAAHSRGQVAPGAHVPGEQVDRLSLRGRDEDLVHELAEGFGAIAFPFVGTCHAVLFRCENLVLKKEGLVHEHEKIAHLAVTQGACYGGL